MEKEIKQKITRFNKQFQKDCLSAICYGKQNDYFLKPFRTPFKQMVNEQGESAIQWLQKECDLIQKQLKPEEKILNKNLEELGIVIC